MAKIIFKKNNISEGSHVRSALNDTQLNQYILTDNFNTFTSVTVSDTDYNDLYKGKKYFTVNSDNTLTFTAHDHGSGNDSTEAEFDTDKENYINWLKNFKEKFPNHPKISEVTASIDFAEAIDKSTMTWPDDRFEKYMIDNNKYVDLKHI